MSVIIIEEPVKRGEARSGLLHHPLFRLGFRPFYLLAALLAAAAIPLWIARWYGVLPGLARIDLNWHMHEMVYGFALAVIIGFLFTAGRNWTGLWTPRRGHLAALAGLWLAGRAAMLLLPPVFAAVVDLLFVPLAAWPMYRVLQRAGNKRNMFLVGLLGLLTAINLAYHLSVLGWLSMPPMHAMQAAILVIVLIEAAIGGRVIPGFTRNAVAGSNPVVHERRDRVTMAVTAAAALGWVAGVPAPLATGLAVAAGCAQLTRLIGWQPHLTLSNPLLWILHASYAWIAGGFLLLGLAAAGVMSESAAFHALAVGSMAGLIIGMITRTALGHTGRALKSGPVELLMYLLIQAGALVRVLAAAGVGGQAMLGVAALCWSAAFLLYVAVYGPYLLRARIDGREG
ncbi:NnrS family protein [Noviherbaspirillum aridicola]|uniref:NnrS family protein n=1 Tax=Noviherbaspirillum aridicola TaxID=2849687 RepID=A0ABQ4Q4D0_9BURK|nr:NnrS family protein [Noviherbaspirillum aridicola]GIZ51680.1 hypothetical protein NCCP691_16940 [Noviherbaspirillum aridicola]